MLLLLLLACITHVGQVQVLAPDHYLIIDDDLVAYDCKSNPNGADWDPICVRVKYVDQAPK